MVHHVTSLLVMKELIIMSAYQTQKMTTTCFGVLPPGITMEIGDIVQVIYFFYQGKSNVFSIALVWLKQAIKIIK